MRIVKRVLSTYSADNFGFCSALYELGGLVVMHDASGCNSTYNTHDEPRWYDTDSLVFISGLTEKDAIFGNDDRLIDDLVKAAEELHPRFVAVCGGPLPHIIGTDFRAVARAVWRRTGIPSFGLQTNGMDSYVRGAGGALAEIAERAEPPVRKRFGLPGKIKINLLGVTPLDFSVNGSVREMEKYFEGQGFCVLSTWAMGNTLDKILASADADVNLVVSACGLPAAKVLLRRFGIPFVVGMPAGRENSREICARLREAAGAGRLQHAGQDGSKTGEEQDTGSAVSRVLPEPERKKRALPAGNAAKDPELSGEEKQGDEDTEAELLIIGEPVQADALAREISLSGQYEKIRIVCPMAGLPEELLAGKEQLVLEQELRDACARADRIIADPLYRRLLPGEEGKFTALPHTAYSGRYYENEMPVLIGEKLNRWLALPKGPKT